jgi:hypothetical protein
MKKEQSETPDKDGIHRQAGMSGKLSKRLDEYMTLRSLGNRWKEDGANI